jgi:hypothetical protein
MLSTADLMFVKTSALFLALFSKIHHYKFLYVLDVCMYNTLIDWNIHTGQVFLGWQVCTSHMHSSTCGPAGCPYVLKYAAHLL